MQYFNNNKYWYKKVIQVSFPLVVSSSTTMVMEVTDRIFLANYSLDAIAAATPGGITAFLFICFFMGIADYVNVFIAQYTGAGKDSKVGTALWQSIWFSLFSALVLAGLWFIAVPLFKLGGHAPGVQHLEVVYFRILCAGAGIYVFQTGLSCFFSGRGITRPVMLVNITGAVFNIPLNYVLINGIGPFPELGIAGAGIATAASWVLMALLFIFLVFTPENDRRYNVIKDWHFNKILFIKLMKFGVPGSIQFCMDIFAFTFFIFMVGRVGTAELAATNIVLSINSLGFMPMIGFSIGVSTLVGQALGNNCPEDAAAAAKSTFHIIYLYLLMLIIAFLFTPEWLLGIFKAENSPEYAEIEKTGIILLRFVSCYLFFDAHYMVFTGVLKGAGDTYFIMWTIFLVSILVMILPLYIGVILYGAGLYYAWTCTTLYIFSLFFLSLWRYHTGKWKSMRLI
ncbi:Multi antimicrobial extrusion protein, MatE family [Desulfonema limicola]|uniref:Multidrug-efflux transporter n=1 Tax=Desulfonema limicola TaxID=45656 RepID=A0A975B9S5_9BACT|nr:MATE family efflux transporter [Desulfonema limicola]QTA81457.1 Multi antimicrobial extrusion protein, MatE family [Desulfonema limicola]